MPRNSALTWWTVVDDSAIGDSLPGLSRREPASCNRSPPLPPVASLAVSDSTIIYTRTDEAPLLATYSLLPIIAAYAAKAGVEVETRDISLAGRIIAQFPDRLTEEQRVDDALAELGDLAKTPEANIIKLPNICASVSQLKAAIKELQEQGYDLPELPRRAEDRRGARGPSPLRQGQGQRGQPGPAGGQLRPPRSGVGEELRPQAPPLDGRVVARTRRRTSRT